MDGCKRPAKHSHLLPGNLLAGAPLAQTSLECLFDAPLPSDLPCDGSGIDALPDAPD